MNHRLLLSGICLLLGIAGCSSNNTGKLEGTKWASRAGAVGSDKIKEGEITIDFGNDGTVRASVFESVVAGKYSLGSGNRVTLDFEDDFLGEKSHRVQIKIDGDIMTMSDANDTLTFSQRKASVEKKKEGS